MTPEEIHRLAVQTERARARQLARDAGRLQHAAQENAATEADTARPRIMPYPAQPTPMLGLAEERTGKRADRERHALRLWDDTRAHA